MFVNLLFGHEELAFLKASVKNKPKEAALVINVMNNIDNIPCGTFKTKNNKYLYLKYIICFLFQFTSLF